MSNACRRKILSIILLSLSILLMPGLEAASKPSNSVWLRSPVELTSRAITISRFFAVGDIPHIAQASIGGKVRQTQCDVRTRWPDGSLKHALVSFVADIPANQNLEVAFVDGEALEGEAAGLTAEEMLKFNNGSWEAILEASARGNGTHRVSAREMLQNGHFRYWQKGPLVTQVIIEGKRESQSSLFAYDFGWRCAEQCDQPGYSSSTWEEITDPAKTPLHPIFILTFYKDHSGVKVEFILENQWASKLADQQFDLSLSTSQSDTVYKRPNLLQPAKTRWRKVFWSGTPLASWKSEFDPGISIDYNLPYMVYSRALPSYDLTLRVPDSAVKAEVNDLAAHKKPEEETQFCENAVYCGQWYRYMGTAGARGDIALIPRWYLRYLYTFRPELYTVMMHDALASGAMPIHVRESLDDRRFLKDSEELALGLPLSVEARPTVRTFTETGQAQPRDKFAFSSSVQCLDSNSFACTSFPTPGRSDVNTVANWRTEVAHQPSISFVPYLITGDYYFLEEMYFWASYNAAYYIPSATCNDYCRGLDWGYLSQPGGIRADAWGLRNLAHATLMAPDSSSERRYYNRMLENNIAIREGFFDIRDGSFFEPLPGQEDAGADPCPANKYNPRSTTRWCWGRVTMAQRADNPLNFPHRGIAAWPGLVPTQIPSADSAWMHNFLRASLGYIEDMGFPIGNVRRAFNKGIISQVLDSEYNPYLAAEYMYAVRNPDGSFIRTWKEVKERFVTTSKLKNPLTGKSLYVDLTEVNGASTGGIRIDVATHIQVGKEIVRVCGSSLLRDGDAYVGTRLTLCAGGRGAKGTSATDHEEGTEVNRLFDEFPTIHTTNFEGSYAFIARAALSFAVDLTVLDSDQNTVLTGKQAWDKWNSMLDPWLSGLNANPMWALVPRPDEVWPAPIPFARTKTDPSKPVLNVRRRD